MISDLKKLLTEYGLGEKEILVYLHLVQKNKLTAYKIAKETKIHRSTCYDVLERLIIKGFISKMGENQKRIYFANDISNIITNLKDKETILLSLIPKIQALEQKQERYVKLLENPISQKEFTQKLLDKVNGGKLTFIYVLGPGPNTNTKISNDLFIKRIIEEALANKLVDKLDYKAIWDPRFRDVEFFKSHRKLGENRFLKLPTTATTLIFEDYVVFLYSLDESEVIEIKNTAIAEEMKAYFNYLWKLAK